MTAAPLRSYDEARPDWFVVFGPLESNVDFKPDYNDKQPNRLL